MTDGKQSPILQLLDEGRLIRRQWTGTDPEGRQTVCLLVALAPEVVVEKDADACPVSILPTWMAHLTLWVDDCGTCDAWPGIVRIYAAIACRWYVLSAADWDRLYYTVCRIGVEFVRPQAGEATLAVDAVLALLRRAETGEIASEEEWQAVRQAAAKVVTDRKQIPAVSRAAKAVEEAADAAAEATAGPGFKTPWRDRAPLWVVRAATQSKAANLTVAEGLLWDKKLEVVTDSLIVAVLKGILAAIERVEQEGKRL